MAEPSVDSRWRYTTDLPLGHLHRVNDPDIDEHAPTQLQTVTPGYVPIELDLHPDTEVTVIGVDDDRGGLILAEWTDQLGNPRVSSFDPALFAEHFQEA